MSWFKKPVNIGIAVGAAILAVVAIVLIVWGVTHHTEGEMLQVCWVNGDAHYVEGTEGARGPCEGPSELAWPAEQVPITVAAAAPDGQALGPDTDESQALAHAVADINRQLGFDLLRVEPRLDAASTVVRFGGAFLSGEESPPPGYVAHRRVASRLQGRVFIRSDVVSETRLLHLVLIHELLHLAGLAHDDFTLSIMYPLVRSEWDTDVMRQAHITDRDRSNLRQRYNAR